MRLAVLPAVHILCRHAIVSKEVYDDITDMVIAHFGNKEYR